MSPRGQRPLAGFPLLQGWGQQSGRQQAWVQTLVRPLGRVAWETLRNLRTPFPHPAPPVYPCYEGE